MACLKNRPSKTQLTYGENSNPHGAGVAWIEKGKVRWVKGVGLSAETLADITARIPLPFVVHFRYTSAGGTCDQLCHPFPITEKVELDSEGTADRVLFHNGHWSPWKYAMETHGIDFGDEKISDTRVIAKIFHDHDHIARRYAESYGKIVLMSATGVEIVSGHWLDQDGILFSNRSCFHRAEAPAWASREPVVSQSRSPYDDE